MFQNTENITYEYIYCIYTYNYWSNYDLINLITRNETQYHKTTEAAIQRFSE